MGPTIIRHTWCISGSRRIPALPSVGCLPGLCLHWTKGSFTLGVEAVKSWGQLNQYFSSFEARARLQGTRYLRTRSSQAMFHIEVFNALQTRFGPSKYTSLKTTLQNATPNCKMKTSLEVLDIICPPQEPDKRRALSLQELALDG